MRQMKLAIILIVVAMAGILISIFPNVGFRNFNQQIDTRISNQSRNFGSQQNFNNTRQILNQSFGFSQIFLIVHIALWIVVLIIAFLLLRKSKK
jgi:uncharacterized membrane protein YidH (DUF202 family)